MTSCLLPLLFLLAAAAAAATREPAGLKIRITDRGLELRESPSHPQQQPIRGLCLMTASPCVAVKSETLKFVEEELSNISIPDMGGSQGRFTYNITK